MVSVCDREAARGMRMKCKRMRRALIGVRTYANMAIVRADEVIEGGAERPSLSS